MIAFISALVGMTLMNVVGNFWGWFITSMITATAVNFLARAGRPNRLLVAVGLGLIAGCLSGSAALLIGGA